MPMTALEYECDLELPFALKEQMLALDCNGYSLLPLGRDIDGKRPSIDFENCSHFPLAFVTGQMVRVGTTMYGIRLPGIVVVDIDNRKPETIAYADRRYGSSPYTVRTRAGEHRYFRAGDIPKAAFIREGVVAIDVKTGVNSYTVGPGSRRPDTGDEYVMDGLPLPHVNELPVFRDREARLGGVEEVETIMSQPGTKKNTGPRCFSEHTPTVVDFSGRGVPDGERWPYLKMMGREFVRNVSSEQALYEVLKAHAKATFENFDSYPDRKYRDVAKWNWKKRLGGDLWGGANAPVQVQPHEVDALAAMGKGGGDGLMLLAKLRHFHAGQPGKRFPITTKTMAAEDIITGWKATRYHRSKELLLKAGLLRCVQRGNFTATSQTASLYQLVSLPIP